MYGSDEYMWVDDVTRRLAPIIAELVVREYEVDSAVKIAWRILESCRQFAVKKYNEG